MKAYPEITALRSTVEKHEITIIYKHSISKENLWVNFSIGSRSWPVFIQDEYQDFDSKLPLMGIFLVFSAFEDYLESDDYLAWSAQLHLDPGDSNLLNYYRTLGDTIGEIKSILGDIAPLINPMDYQLRTGIIDALLTIENNRFE